MIEINNALGRIEKLYKSALGSTTIVAKAIVTGLTPQLWVRAKK